MFTKEEITNIVAIWSEDEDVRYNVEKIIYCYDFCVFKIKTKNININDNECNYCLIFGQKNAVTGINHFTTVKEESYDYPVTLAESQPGLIIINAGNKEYLAFPGQKEMTLKTKELLKHPKGWLTTDDLINDLSFDISIYMENEIMDYILKSCPIAKNPSWFFALSGKALAKNYQENKEHLVLKCYDPNIKEEILDVIKRIPHRPNQGYVPDTLLASRPDKIEAYIRAGGKISFFRDNENGYIHGYYDKNLILP
jgi:hypothetical protein